MKKVIISTLAMGMSLMSHASVINDGQQIFSADISHTVASELFMGNGSKSSYGDAITTFMQYGLGYSRGLGSGLQVDGRIAYTSSKIEGGDKGGVVDGDSVNEISEVSLKLIKGFENDFDLYVKYSHPGTSNDPGEKGDADRKLFIAVNDFSSHLALGVTKAFRFASKFSLALDFNYTHRFTEDLPDGDKMGGQINFMGSLSYQLTDQLTISPGFAYRDTQEGIDIGEGDFYAVKEKLQGYTLGVSYFFPDSGSWIAGSLFQKTDGLNTDVSTTSSLNFGKYF